VLNQVNGKEGKLIKKGSITLKSITYMQIINLIPGSAFRFKIKIKKYPTQYQAYSRKGFFWLYDDGINNQRPGKQHH
jgi:hypothetical protein